MAKPYGVLLGIALALFCSLNVHASAYMLKYERIETRSGVDVVIHGCGTATCFKKGLLLTAAHNLFHNDKPIDQVKIKIGNVWESITVSKTDKSIDLAIIKCEAADDVLEIATEDVKVGTEITLTGSKRGAPIKLFKGKVLTAWHEGFARYLAEISFDHGDSGAPVLFDKKIVGIATAGLPLNGDIDTTKCLFVPVSVIRTFLKD